MTEEKLLDSWAVLTALEFLILGLEFCFIVWQYKKSEKG